MSEEILIALDLTGGDFSDTTYYVSENIYIGANLYQPFLLRPPVIKIGEVDKGFLKVEIGNLSFSNEPTNPEHPFYGTRYSTLLAEQTLIPFTLSISETTTPLFTGNLGLIGVSEQELEFQIYDEASDLSNLKLLQRTLDENAVTISSIDSNGNALQITTSSAHGLSNGQAVIFEDMQTYARELEYSSITNNFYTVKNKASTTFEIADNTGIEVDKTDVEYRNDSSGSVTLTKSGNIASIWTIASGVTITIASGVTITVESDNTAIVGAPIGRPLAFGRIQHATPVVYRDKSTGKIVNPLMDIAVDNTTAVIEDVFLQVFEDGVEIGTTESGDSKEFTTAATSDLIKTDASFTGQISLSGAGSNGTSIVEFFENIVVGQAKIEGNTLTIDTTYAPDSEEINPGFEIYAESLQSLPTQSGSQTTDNLSVTGNVIFATPFTINDGHTVTVESGAVLTIKTVPGATTQPAFINALSFYETKQQALFEFADKVAKFVNHQFFIKNQILYLVSRTNIPETWTDYTENEIISLDIEVKSPIRSIKSEWDINEATGQEVTSGAPNQGYPMLTSIPKSANAELLGVGQDIDIDSFHQQRPAVQGYLNNILFTEKKPIIRVKLEGIKTDAFLGDRVKFSYSPHFVTSDMLVRSVEFDFDEFTTTFAGDATLTQLELS